MLCDKKFTVWGSTGITLVQCLFCLPALPHIRSDAAGRMITGFKLLLCLARYVVASGVYLFLKSC